MKPKPAIVASPIRSDGVDGWSIYKVWVEHVTDILLGYDIRDQMTEEVFEENGRDEVPQSEWEDSWHQAMKDITDALAGDNPLPSGVSEWDWVETKERAFRIA